MVTVAPVPLILRALALPSDAAGLTSETGVEVSVVPEAILNESVASTPFPIEVVLIPETIHRTSPAEMRLQSTNLPAEVPAAPFASYVPVSRLRSEVE
jgi:hypothetical protein